MLLEIEYEHVRDLVTIAKAKNFTRIFVQRGVYPEWDDFWFIDRAEGTDTIYHYCRVDAELYNDTFLDITRNIDVIEAEFSVWR